MIGNLLKKILCAVVLVSLIAINANAKVLFYNSFDTGFNAEFALGSTLAVHHDSLCLVPAKQGKGLWCKPNEYIRYETDGNIDLNQCSISFWIKPNYIPNSYRPDYAPAVQCIFSMRIRTNDLIELRLRNDKATPVLWLMTGAKDQKRSNINYEIKDWDADTWHKILISWKKPGSLALQVDDNPAKVIEGAILPMLPAKMLYDFYFGTNSKQSSYARMEHFDGIIDEICITDQWLNTPAKFNVPEVKNAIPCGINKTPDHVSKNRRRQNIFVQPKNKKWDQLPVKVKIDLGEKWKELSPSQKRAAVNSFRLVKYTPDTGKPVIYDDSQNSENKYYMPFIVDDDVFYKNVATLRFAHTTADQACYSFYYDYESFYTKPFPDQIPMVGNGERLKVGKKSTVGTLCSGISGIFDVHDIDGDGDLDLWMNSGTIKTRSCTHLQVGHFYFENVSNEIGVKDTFAPGRLIIRDNTPYGFVAGVVVPCFGDINNDGQKDMLMLGRSCQEWWQWHYEDGNVIVDKINKFVFNGEPLKSEYKTYWYDWDGDGLGDVIASGLLDLSKDDLIPVFKIYRNIGRADAPVIDTKNPIELNIGKPLLQWQYIPVDWDSDGDMDFVSAGFIHELYFHENIGDNTNFNFNKPVRIKTFDRREINITQALVNIVVSDWDSDGDIDLLYGCEDGLVGLMENIAGKGVTPKLRQPVFLQQQRPLVDGGTISVPVITDWDDDGDNDLILAASNTMQYYQNTGSNSKPVWSWPENMQAGGSLIELRAGDDGSIQGLEELCWQYNNAEVADWDGDGLKDLIISGIRGEHVFFKNIGIKGHPRLAAGQLLKVDWPGQPVYPKWIPFRPAENSLVTVWRTKPEIIDWNKDGLMDYITLDHKGDLALYLRERKSDGTTTLKPPMYIFEIQTPYSQAIVWNRPKNATEGRSGRTVINIVDWDKDGDYDLILDNVNARYYENTTNNDKPLFVDKGDLVKERLANHNDGPYVADWDNDGWDDLFVGAETGRVYYFSRPYIEKDIPLVKLID